jgi:membrane-associated phospholipid phosphatase
MRKRADRKKLDCPDTTYNACIFRTVRREPRPTFELWGRALSRKASLRIAEWVQLSFVLVLACVAWLRPLERKRRLRVTWLALATIAAIFAVRLLGDRISPVVSSIVRDWLPAGLLLVPYWQVGQFFTAPDPRMEARLAALDRAFFHRIGIQPSRVRIDVGLATYLQLAYFMVYPLIPLGLAALYATGQRRCVDYYWLVVLPATYLSFALTPFVRALPPRMLAGYDTFRSPPTKIAALNRVILDRASIQAITCPSGHVASATAAALVLLRLQPWMGAVFLWIAISIAVATVVGGYHYAVDVLLASAIAILVFAVTYSSGHASCI